MTPLVLLPGMMCDSRLFGPQIIALGTNRAIHVAPLCHHGTMAGLAQDILANAPPRFALAGLSMGGIVAMEIMAQAPDRVELLALLDTNAKAERPEVKARRGPQIARVNAGELRAVMREEMKPNYIADGANKQPVLDLCMDMALALGPQSFINQSAALRDRPDYQDVLAKVAVPTLVLCGREDRLCPIANHELMQSLIPHARLRIIEGAGHLPTLEQPDNTTAALARWLEE